MNKEELITRLKLFGISARVVQAISKVNRELFVPPHMRGVAWEDQPLPIGHNQTISQPLMVADMTEKLDVRSRQRVLEIGAGSGYQAAILKELVGKNGLVVDVERIPELADYARANLEGAKCDVEIFIGDGTLGYPEKAPYDRIMVTAASPGIPNPLVEQLKIGGKIAIPIGRGLQTLVVAEKIDSESLEKAYYGSCIFVPLLGEHGFNY